MKKELIEVETLKQLTIMNRENKARPSLMTPKYFDGNLVVTNSHVAIKVADEKYKDDDRTDYPNNAVQLFGREVIDWIKLDQVDMKALKEFAGTFKRLKETNIVITFDRDNFVIEGYNNKVRTHLPYQKIKYSGNMVGKNIMIDPKYLEQILTYYIKLKATSVNLELTGEKYPIKVTSGNVQYLAAQIRTPR